MIRLALAGLLLWVALGSVVASLLAIAGRRNRFEPTAHLPPVVVPVPVPVRDEVDASAVVAVHGLQASAAVIVGGGEALRDSWHVMTDDQRTAVLEVVVAQAALVQGLVDDLLSSAPPELRAALDELGAAQPLPDSGDRASR